MPLQKPRFNGTPTSDVQATKRRQLQERRRTLQTISELSATATTVPDFKTSTSNGQMAPSGRSSIASDGQKTPNANKRRSLPQYCARPECDQARSPPPVPSVHTPAARHNSSHKSSHAKSSPPYEAGWNARRELARKQAEQALLGIGVQREPSMPDQRVGSRPTQLSVLSTPRSKSSEPYLKSYYSQQHSLRNSRSMSSTTPRPDQRLSSGAPPCAPPRETYRDVEPSERTSIDSSSFHSSRDSAIRRSRSSSSSQSFNLQGVPPLPSGCAQPANAYYNALHSPYHTGYPIQLPGRMYAQAPSEMRATSLPYMMAGSLPRHSYTGMSTALYSHPPPKQHGHVQRTRPKSLSAQTSSGHQQPLSKHPSQSSIKSQGRVHSTHQQRHAPPTPTLTPSPRSQRHRSTSSLKVPPNAHLSQRKESSDHSPNSAALPPRPVPDRSSLTKWKSEREEARAEFDGMQRAKVQERVRRANEMEQEKERELQMLGRGAEKGKRVLGVGLSEKEGKKMKTRRARSCFGGWRWSSGWTERVMSRWR